MEKSGHVLMVGKGAEQFALDSKLEIVDPSYFWTQFRWNQYQTALRLEKELEKLPPTPPGDAKQSSALPRDETELRRFRASGLNRFGTVGAVALDKAGNLAAGTSTGGLNMKRSGRVGDSPLIGAGTFADNESCAISSTGDGEYFIRAVAAYDISALVKYKGLSIAAASNEVIQHKIKDAGGDGAVIVLNRQGEAAMSFNTEGMYRGYVSPDGKMHVFIYEQ